MALKHFKPKTPGLRQLVLVDRTGLHKGAPIKALTEGKHSSGGRNNLGRRTARWRGGGAKKRYRIIDFKRRKWDMPATIERLEYDPNRTAFIALIKYTDGELAYIIAPQRVDVGDTVIAGEHNDASAIELRWGTIALARRNPDGKIFQPAQRAVWLGQQILAATCRCAGPSIRRCNIGELHQFDAVSGGLTQSGWPAITSTTLSQHSAILWFTTPSSSANRRPAAVAGITVKPTSGLTRTSGAPNEPTAATN
jgi:hypothetical protein